MGNMAGESNTERHTSKDSSQQTKGVFKEEGTNLGSAIFSAAGQRGVLTSGERGGLTGSVVYKNRGIKKKSLSLQKTEGEEIP